ncbi:High-affinity zinc uptake system protein ZnuA [Nocardioides aquaticus]|uniref:High-affinity zinc uptake system protein ZnuA n=1 Tax=Nocardioides aquaticus TaxID=160826 RepID=A0ABX8EGJ0_9ACTN|nr:metal ABC transporter substrate-binding protein [Nocardioides aquaticus]QVT79632.1 High-affinity zinc uptake system protein ZnuA [Nocardioides aquaticus]
MKSRRLRSLPVLASVALASLTLSSCAAFSDGTASTVEDGGTPQVVAAFYPLEYVASRVAGDRADVSSLTAPGQEPHDLELSVADNATVAGADLVVLEGGLQAAVDEAVGQNAPGEVLDVTDVVELTPLDEEHDHAEEEGHEGETAEEHAEHAGEGHEEDHEGHDHGDLGDLDPHFWLDPTLMADAGDAVAEAMAEVDPDGAEEYAAGAADLRSDLEALDADLQAGLASCERDTIVVSHDAFGYLDRYGLDVEAVAGLSPDAEPNPADLGRLQELIATDGITTVFSERLASPALTESLARDAGVETAVLDPIEGLTEETAEEDYLSLMRSNLEALRAANGCS